MPAISNAANRIRPPLNQGSVAVALREPHSRDTRPDLREPKVASPTQVPVSSGDIEGSEHPSLVLLASEQDHLRRDLGILTEREREVVLAICAGGTNEAIASRLCIALPTLRTHLMRLNQKLGTTSKGDVVRFAASILIEAYRRGELRADSSGVSAGLATPR
jgi:DNA-binding CsgD family transcriptional regulator